MKTLLLLACAVIVVGCSSSPSKPGPIGAPATPTASTEYKIGPGDTLQVFVWNRPELSVTVPVRPDGHVSTPLIENMKADGKTPSELARDMEVALAEYVRTPKVNIIVTSFVGGDQVRVIGQAARPQSLPFRVGMTLLDVMIAVGGLGEFAAGNRSQLSRIVNGQQTKTRIRLQDLLNGDMGANLPVLPGDVIFIPETRF